MIVNQRITFCFLCISAGLLIHLSQTFCQESSTRSNGVNISGGLGIPELVNAGLQFHYKQVKLSLSMGFLPLMGYNLTYSGDFYYHFAGHSKFSKTNTWYGKIGLISLISIVNDRTEKYTYLNLRAGRDVYSSPRFGIEIDGGIGFKLSEKYDPPRQTWDTSEIPSLIPGFGIRVFYRL